MQRACAVVVACVLHSRVVAEARTECGVGRAARGLRRRRVRRREVVMLFYRGDRRGRVVVAMVGREWSRSVNGRGAGVGGERCQTISRV